MLRGLLSSTFLRESTPGPTCSYSVPRVTSLPKGTKSSNRLKNSVPRILFMESGTSIIFHHKDQNLQKLKITGRSSSLHKDPTLSQSWPQRSLQKSLRTRRKAILRNQKKRRKRLYITSLIGKVI
jgi:hypothetical protein